MRNDSPGNALWFILLGIFLLGILTMMLSRSGSSVDQSGDFEQNRIQISDILRQAKSIEQAVRTMQSAGVSENELSFEGIPGHANAGCAADSCKVFKGAGGAQNYKSARAVWLDPSQSAKVLYGEWFVPANICVDGVPPDAGTCESDGSAATEDLVIVLPWIRADLCRQINADLGIDNPGGNPPVETGNAWASGNASFSGGFADGEKIDDAGGVLRGKRSGCFAGKSGSTPDGGYHFYQVLLAR